MAKKAAAVAEGIGGRENASHGNGLQKGTVPLAGAIRLRDNGPQRRLTGEGLWIPGD